MREWLSGGAPPCQGGGRGFDPRLALFFFTIKWVPLKGTHFIVKTSPRGSNRFDFSPAGSVGASPLRGESSTGRLYPVSYFLYAI